MARRSVGYAAQRRRPVAGHGVCLRSPGAEVLVDISLLLSAQLPFARRLEFDRAAGDVAMRRAVTFAAGRPRIGVDRYLEARNAAEQVGDSVVVPRRRRVRALPALDV